ncbi:hypothetical protein BgiMline_029895, partial [Biomphalaria glabrata]
NRRVRLKCVQNMSASSRTLCWLASSLSMTILIEADQQNKDTATMDEIKRRINDNWTGPKSDQRFR